MSKQSNRRGMITPYEKKDGSLSYRLKWWERGVAGQRVQRQRTFATETEALDHKAKIRTAQSEGTHTTRKAGRTPFEELGREWLGGKRLKSASTFRTYDSLYRNHVEPVFAGRAVASITSHAVQEWIFDRMDVLKPSSLERVYKNVLSPIFALGVSKRCMIESPCSKAVTLPFIEHQEQRYCTESEVWELADAIQHEGYPSLAVLFLAYTGLRFGEFAGLKIRYVDLTKRTIRVEGQVIDRENGRAAYTTKLKTPRARRTVGVPEWLSKRMTEHMTGQAGDYLFREADGGFVRYGKFAGALKRARKPVYLDDVHVHSLRHTFAALAISEGAELLRLSRQMGHASTNVTESVYGHFWIEDVHCIADLLELKRRPALARVV